MKLKYRQFIHRLIQRCIEKIKSSEKVDQLRFSAELSIEIAKFINQSILEANNINENKVDRTEILINAFNEVFHYTDSELELFQSNIIEFLIDRKLIKRIKVSKKLMKVLQQPAKFFFKILKAFV